MILRAAGLLLRLRARRLLNLLTAGRRKGPDGRRHGTARRGNWWLPALVVLVNVVGAVLLSHATIGRARERLEGLRPHAALVEVEALGPAVQGEVALVAALACAVGLLMSLGGKELSSPDWDLEWLATLPLPRRELLAVRLGERALLNPVAVLTLWPLLSVTAAWQGHGLLSPLLALLATLPLLLLVGCLHLLADTGLRLRLAPQRLRGIQAGCGLLGLVGLYLMLSAGQSSQSLVHDVAAALPAWFRWTPPGLALLALAPGQPLTALAALGLLACVALAGALFTLAALERALRDGLLAAGARESARGAVPAARPARGPRRWVTALQARELKLLARDRAFLVQTLVLPVVILGAQFVFNMRLTSDMTSDPRHLGAAAFAVMSYALLFSTFQTLSAEGHALWLLFTFPRPLDALLREKARLWSVVALVFPSGVFALGLWASERHGWDAAGIALLVLAGVPIYATIGTCLGVLGWDPLAPDQRRRIKPGWGWLYMLLAALFTYAIYAQDWWSRGVLVVLAAGLAWSLWQRVHDRLPYLLDPGEAPPPRVSLSDGMVALLLFFVLQALGALALQEALGSERLGAAVALAYAAAGGVVYVAFRAVFRWRGTQGTPHLAGPAPWRGAAALGLLAGALAGAATPLLLGRVEAFAPELAASRQALRDWPVALPLLAIVAAPLCEEYLFRGLVFAGLRRSLGALPAVAASAALFAIVHPPLSMPAVFVLGLLAALAYERTGGLAVPMLVHAGFNAASLAVQASG